MDTATVSTDTLASMELLFVSNVDFSCAPFHEVLLGT